MKNIIKNILRDTSTPPRQKYLNKIFSYGNHFEPVPESDRYPAHLIAHGIVKVEEQTFETRTAINVKVGPTRDHDDIEFSTNVGQIQNRPSGNTVVESLNHVIDGKFVTFQTEQSEKADLVYTTRRPANWLNEKRLERELENHAQVKAIINPLLEQSFKIEEKSSNLPFPEIRKRAEDFVESRLFRHQLQNNLSPISYRPKSENLTDE